MIKKAVPCILNTIILKKNPKSHSDSTGFHLSFSHNSLKISHSFLLVIF